MSKRRILIQLDPDPHPSVFDAVVAIDSEIDQLLQYGGVVPAQVRNLVHGAMFTRGPQDLHSTAVFIGGSNVAEGEALLREVTRCFFGPMRVSVMFDANGANTTAAAAVLAAERHRPLSGSTATVLAATGPVGQRIVRLLARQGAHVRVVSRTRERAQQVCDAVSQLVPAATLSPFACASASEAHHAIGDSELLFAAGAAGIELVTLASRQQCPKLEVAIDLNAVPPYGITGIDAQQAGDSRDGVCGYGALAVGGRKMKIHKAAIRKLFTENNLVLDAEETCAIGRGLSS